MSGRRSPPEGALPQKAHSPRSRTPPEAALPQKPQQQPHSSMSRGQLDLDVDLTGSRSTPPLPYMVV